MKIMKILKFSLLAAALTVSAACKQEHSVPADSAPAAEASAPTASRTTASAEPAFTLSGAKDAKWQPYQCHDGLALSARYFSGENGEPAAEVRFDGKLFKLKHNSEYSNQDLTAFGDGTHTWTVGNIQQTDIYKEDNGFFIRHEMQQAGSEVLPVDLILAKNCMPAQ